MPVEALVGSKDRNPDRVLPAVVDRVLPAGQDRHRLVMVLEERLTQRVDPLMKLLAIRGFVTCSDRGEKVTSI